MTAAAPGIAVGAATRAALLLFTLSVPLDTVGEGVSPAAVTGLLLTAAGLMDLLRSGSVRPLGAGQVAQLAFAVWAIASILWSFDRPATLDEALKYAQLAVVCFFVWQAVRTELQLRDQLVAFLVGASIAALGTIRDYQSGVTAENETAYRFAAFGYDPNDLCVTLALGIPMAWYLLVQHRGWAFRAVALGYLPLALFGAILTASRGGFIAVIVALTVVPLTFRGIGVVAKAAVLLVAGALVVLVFQVAPAESWERLLTTGDEVMGGTLTHRSLIWRSSWEVFTQHWLAGVGVGALSLANEQILNWNRDAHNTFLHVLAEGGVLGFTIFVFPFAAAARGAWRRTQGALRPALLVLLATWAIGVFSLGWHYRKTTWLVGSLALAGAALAPLARRAPRAPAVNAAHEPRPEPA